MSSAIRDSWDTFLAIRELVRLGVDTQEAIAERLGLYKIQGRHAGQPDRLFIQLRVQLSRMPQFVQDEFERFCRKGRDATPVRWVHIPRLYGVYCVEYARYPNGDGPEFRAAWREVLTTPCSTKGVLVADLITQFDTFDLT